MQQDNNVLLEWKTAQEKDVDIYTIERSYDAKSWAFVGTKEPVSATSSDKRTYQLVDTEPGTGIVYYRLTETDLNGKKTYAPLAFVKIGATYAGDSRIYPNPTTGAEFTVASAMFLQTDVQVTVMSADGKLVARKNVTDRQETVSFSNLNVPAGNYYVLLHGTNGNSETLKLQVTGQP